MRIEGTYTFAAPIDQVFSALTHPDILSQVIPGWLACPFGINSPFDCLNLDYADLGLHRLPTNSIREIC